MSDSPAAMLAVFQPRLLQAEGVGSHAAPPQFPAPSERKIRLFACACVRQVWELLADGSPCGRCGGRGVIHPRTYCPDCNDNGTGTTPGRVNRSRRAVEVAELYADGQATAGELLRACQDAADVCERDDGFEAELAWRCAYSDVEALTQDAGLPRWFSVSTKLAAAQASLLRCVAGNPFRPVTLPNSPEVACAACGGTTRAGWPGSKRGTCPACGGRGRVAGPCPWLTPTALTLAEAAYRERPGRRCEACGGEGEVGYVGGPGRRVGGHDCRLCNGTGRAEGGSLDPEALAVLADALEEAGAEGAILEHLRGPGPHARGCWALDLILGRG